MEVELSKEQADEAEVEYNTLFEFLFNLFDGKPFQISAPGEEKSKVSAALYDASMVAACRLKADLDNITADKENVQQRLADAVQNADQYEVIVGRGNTAEAVRERIYLLQNILKPT